MTKQLPRGEKKERKKKVDAVITPPQVPILPPTILNHRIREAASVHQSGDSSHMTLQIHLTASTLRLLQTSAGQTRVSNIAALFESSV